MERKRLARRVELARQTYLEVLDATKHQDDKVNRFLVAIAFLTTGAIAFLLQSDVLRLRHEAEGWHLPLLAVSAGGYLASTAVAVVLLLMALSSELKLPGRKPGPRRKPEALSLDSSLLYFQMIGSRTVAKWMKDWDKDEAGLESDIGRQYVREAHNLSERARVKYGITDEAASIYIYGVMWLGLGLLLGTHALQRPVPQPLGEMPLAGWPLSLLIGVLSVHGVLQLHTVRRHERSAPQVSWALAARRVRKARREHAHELSDTLMDAARDGDRRAGSLFPLFLLGLLLPVYVGVTAFGAVNGGVAGGWLAAAASAVSWGAAWVAWPRLRYSTGRIRQGMLAASVIGGGAVPVTAHMTTTPWLWLAAAAAPATLLSALTVTRQMQQSYKEVLGYAGRLFPPEVDEAADEELLADIDDEDRRLDKKERQALGKNGAAAAKAARSRRAALKKVDREREDRRDLAREAAKREAEAIFLKWDEPGPWKPPGSPE